MKIQHQNADQRRILTIAWITSATEFMVTALHGHTLADVDAGIEHAVDLFVNRGETPGSAIPAGVKLARHRIRQRQAAAVSRNVIIAFLTQQRKTVGCASRTMPG